MKRFFSVPNKKKMKNTEDSETMFPSDVLSLLSDY